MADFKEFIKGFAKTALENKGFKVGDIVDNIDGYKYRVLDPNEDKLGSKTWGDTHILVQQIDDKGKDDYSRVGNHGWFPSGGLSLSKYAKAKRLIDEDNAGYPPYFYKEKDGKFFLKGMDGEKDKELSIDELASIYDKRKK